MPVPTLDQFLLYAAMADDLELVEQRLALGASPAYMDKDKGSALMQACQRGGLEVARRLLSAGADPNAIIESTGLSAVQYADECGRWDMVDLCCEYGGIRIPTDERLGSLIRPFEIRCAFACCGWDAFDFSPAGVEEARAQGVSLQTIREEALRGIDFLRGVKRWVRLYENIPMGSAHIPLLEKLLRSVDEVEARKVK